MNITLRAGLTLASLALALSASNGVAFAWGCTAVSDQGTYGYSYNYDSEGAARNKALNECAKRTTEDSTCEINECDQDS